MEMSDLTGFGTEMIVLGTVMPVISGLIRDHVPSGQKSLQYKKLCRQYEDVRPDWPQYKDVCNRRVDPGSRSDGAKSLE